MLNYVQITKEGYSLWLEELHPSAVILLIFYIFVDSSRSKTSWHGQESISQTTRLSESTLSRCLKELERLNYVIVDRRPHKSNTVRLNTVKLKGAGIKLKTVGNQNDSPKDQKGRRRQEEESLEKYGFIQTN